MEQLVHSHSSIEDQFPSDESVSIDDQIRIVININQLMDAHNVRIFRDRGHSSWVCLKFNQAAQSSKKQREKTITFLTPTKGFDWLEFNQSNQEITKEIKQWLPQLKNPSEVFVLQECYKSSDSTIQFLAVLAFAIGSVLNFPVYYLHPFGAMNNEMKKIREAVLNALKEARLPTKEAMWG